MLNLIVTIYHVRIVRIATGKAIHNICSKHDACKTHGNNLFLSFLDESRTRKHSNVPVTLQIIELLFLVGWLWSSYVISLLLSPSFSCYFSPVFFAVVYNISVSITRKTRVQIVVSLEVWSCKVCVDCHCRRRVPVISTYKHIKCYSCMCITVTSHRPMDTRLNL